MYIVHVSYYLPKIDGHSIVFWCQLKLMKPVIYCCHCSCVVTQLFVVRGGSIKIFLGPCPQQIECLLPSRLGGSELPQLGPGQSTGWKCILLYFEGHRTLLYVPICGFFEFVKQCFMSHLGSRLGFIGYINIGSYNSPM